MFTVTFFPHTELTGYSSRALIIVVIIIIITIIITIYTVILTIIVSIITACVIIATATDRRVTRRDVCARRRR